VLNDVSEEDVCCSCAACNRAPALEPGHSIDDLDLEVSESVSTVRHSRGRHGVRNGSHAVHTSGPHGVVPEGWVNVQAIGDQLDGYAVVVEQSHNGSRLAVVYRGHRVEEVRSLPGACIDRGPRDCIVGVSVSDSDNRTRLSDLPDSVERAMALRRQGHHCDCLGSKQRAKLTRLWITQLSRIMCTAPSLGQPWSFQMDAGNFAVVDELAQRCNIPPQLQA
jgi:hypothetical protein